MQNQKTKPQTKKKKEKQNKKCLGSPIPARPHILRAQPVVVVMVEAGAASETRQKVVFHMAMGQKETKNLGKNTGFSLFFLQVFDGFFKKKPKTLEKAQVLVYFSYRFLMFFFSKKTQKPWKNHRV